MVDVVNLALINQYAEQFVELSGLAASVSAPSTNGKIPLPLGVAWEEGVAE